MSEEQQESTGSSLKKTILGTIATVVTAGGAWLGSTLFGGGEDKSAAPAPAPVKKKDGDEFKEEAPKW